METTGQTVFFGPLRQYCTPVPDIPMCCCRLDGFWQRGAAENAHLKTGEACAAVSDGPPAAQAI